MYHVDWTTKFDVFNTRIDDASGRRYITQSHDVIKGSHDVTSMYVADTLSLEDQGYTATRRYQDVTNVTCDFDCVTNASREWGVTSASLGNWGALFLVTVALAGVVGNLLVCVAVKVERRLRNETNLFLVSLAVADLLVSCVVMPGCTVQEFIGYWPFGFVLCDAWQACDVMLCTSSIMHMCTISIDRYIGLRNPMTIRSRSPVVVAVKIGLVWFISLLIASPVVLLAILRPDDVMMTSAFSHCSINNRSFFVYGSLSAFFVPLAIMLVAYSLSISLLRSQARSLSPHDGVSDDAITTPCGGLRRMRTIRVRDRPAPTPSSTMERRYDWSHSRNRKCSSQASTTESALPMNHTRHILSSSSSSSSSSKLLHRQKPIRRRLKNCDNEANEFSVFKNTEQLGELVKGEARCYEIKDGNRDIGHANKDERRYSGAILDSTKHNHRAQSEPLCPGAATGENQTDMLMSCDKLNATSPHGDLSNHSIRIPVQNVASAHTGLSRVNTCPLLSPDGVSKDSIFTTVFYKNRILRSRSTEITLVPNPPDDMNEECHKQDFNTRTGYNSTTSQYDALLDSSNSNYLRCHYDRTQIDTDVLCDVELIKFDNDDCVCTKNPKAEVDKVSLNSHNSTDQNSRHQDQNLPDHNFPDNILSGINKSTDAMKECKGSEHFHSEASVDDESCGRRERVGEKMVDGRKEFHQDNDQEAQEVDNNNIGHLRAPEVKKTEAPDKETCGADSPTDPAQDGDNIDSAARFRSLVRKHSVTLRVTGMLLRRRDDTRRKTMAAALNNVRTERKAIKVLGAMFFIFIICWAPFFTANLAMGLCGDGGGDTGGEEGGGSEIGSGVIEGAGRNAAQEGGVEETGACGLDSVVFRAFLWLGYVSSTVNPIVYTVFNKTFRRTFKQLILFRHPGCCGCFCLGCCYRDSSAVTGHQHICSNCRCSSCSNYSAVRGRADMDDKMRTI